MTTADAPLALSVDLRRPVVRRRVSLSRVISYVALVAMTLVILGPVLWAIASSFKTQAELAAQPPVVWPSSFSLRNYTEALQTFSFVTYLTNSVIVTVGATLLTLVINTMCAYALAKHRFHGRDAIFLLILSTIMIPLPVILIPVYQAAAQVHLVNSLWGLIIPTAATPTGVFLVRQYMTTIPDDILEAARLDGAGEMRIFMQIVVPLSAPAIGVLAIFSAVFRWNDFIWPLLISQSQDKYTLPVALAQFSGELVVPFNYILAMSVVSILPMIVVFVLLQRYIVQGIAHTGIK